MAASPNATARGRQLTAAPVARPRGRPPGSGSDKERSILQMIKEVGTTGTKNFSGILLDEYLPQLSFYNSATVYNQMRRSDATVAALLAAYVMPLRAAKWYMQPFDESDDALNAADFVHDNLWNFGAQTFDDFMREVLTMEAFGFSWFEKIFTYIEDGPYKGKIGWDRFAFRYQNTRYKYNTKVVTGAGGSIHRKLVSVTQFAPPDYQMVEIPVEKLLIFSRDKEGDNYDGISLLRAVYKHWVIKDALYRIQSIGLERAAVGVPYARYLMRVSDDEIATITQMLENLRVDDQAYVQYDGEKVEIGYLENHFLADALHQAIEHHDTQVMKAGLAQFVNLGTRSTGATGSYALSQDQSQMFLDALNGEANYIASAFHLQATQQLLRFNYPTLDRLMYPRLAHGDIGERSAVKLAQALNAFAQYGFITADPHTENTLRQFMDLPPRDEEWRQLIAEQALAPTPYPGGDGGKSDADSTPIPQVAPPGSQPGAGVNPAGSGAGIKGGAGKQMGNGKNGRARSLNNTQFGSKSGGGLKANELAEREYRERNWDKHREQAYVTYMAEVEALKTETINHRPLRPSERAALRQRAYEIRGVSE